MMNSAMVPLCGEDANFCFRLFGSVLGLIGGEQSLVADCFHRRTCHSTKSDLDRRATMNTNQIDQIQAILNAAYPGWTGPSDPRFVADEINYKREANQKAAARLSRSALADLIERGRFTEVVQRLEELGKATNLLYLSTPRTSDLGILYDPGLDEEAFAHQIHELLYGEGSSPERLDRYVQWVERQGLPNKWTFPTYFLFLLDPANEMFIKPRTVKRFLKFVEAGFEIGTKPTGEAYGRVLEVARQVGKALFGVDSGADMVLVQSVVWVVGRRGYKIGVDKFDPEKEQTFERLLEEFGRTYAREPDGLDHLSRYDDIREVGRRNFEAILEARESGQDVTDLVLAKLLPHRDSAANRARGAWIHLAPVIAGDVRTWYGNSGNVSADDWPRVSRTILDFVERVAEDPDDLASACKRFADADLKGFQTGMLTPILSALHPDQLILINNKSRAVVNHFLGSSYGQPISEYPGLNTAAHYLINRMRNQLLAVTPDGVSSIDGFDAFTHWLVAIKKYRFGAQHSWRIDVVDAGNWDAWQQGNFVGLTESAVEDLGSVKKKKDWEDLRASALAEDSEIDGEALDEVWKLATETQEGDFVLATSGTGSVLGIGMIVGPYEYDPDVEPQHRLPAEWQDTDVRAVSEPGWRNRFHEVDPKFVEKVRGLPPVVMTEGAFDHRAFELLADLHKTPTREFYAEHQEQFRNFVENPLKELMAGIAALLPPAMKEILETEKRLFSRITKNDFGHGGAWDFYWGAFYPKGGRRIEDAQLYIWLNRECLEYGFYIGAYGDEQRTRFLNNVRRRREALTAALTQHLDPNRYIFGAPRDDDGTLATETASDNPHDWLANIAERSLSARVSLSRDRVLATSATDLLDQILDAFRQLFPLVLLAISDDPLSAIAEYWGTEDDDREIEPVYTLDECAAQTGFDVTTLRSWARATERKGQAIFYGPPGTGKTFIAERIARHIVGGGDGFTDLVQFHPAYAYEDFIQGIRPITRADGTLEYQMVPGRFLEFCRRAQARSGRCVLIIDEINRANLSRVFGELMYLLEYRDRDIPLSGGGTFRIPNNVRMLGTMNTADRSIALVDHALRRRFAFIHLRPEFDVLRVYHEHTGKSVDGLIEKLIQINQAIGDENYHLGITFFMDPALDDNLEGIWQMEIEPYLEEYFFDDPKTVDRFRWIRIGEDIAV